MTRRTKGSALDLPRQLFVTLSALVMLVAALAGAGLVAKIPVLKDLSWLPRVPIEEAAGGWLGPGTTLFSLPSAAFMVWGLIYLGLVAYTVWQWLGDRGDDPRYRGSGWWLGLAMLGTAAWIYTAQRGWLWASVAVLALVVVVSFVAVRELSGHSSSRSLATTLMSDLGPGLLLGWTTIALVGNLAAAAGASGFRPGGWLGTIIGIVLLLVVLVLSGLYIRLIGPRLSVAIGMVWGLGWLAWGRLQERPRAEIFGWSSVGVAIMVAFLTIGALIHVGIDD